MSVSISLFYSLTTALIILKNPSILLIHFVSSSLNIKIHSDQEASIEFFFFFVCLYCLLSFSAHFFFSKESFISLNLIEKLFLIEQVFL